MSPVLKRIYQLLLIVLVQAAILFLCAGSLTWAAGWWSVGLYLALLLAASFKMIPNHPEVIAARSRGAEGARPWVCWRWRVWMSAGT